MTRHSSRVPPVEILTELAKLEIKVIVVSRSVVQIGILDSKKLAPFLGISGQPCFHHVNM